MSHAPSAETERTAGLLLMGAAAAALALANSPLAASYAEALHLMVGPLSVHQWVADVLMALFFLLVGLEVKREWYVGRLSRPADRRLPILAAALGMAVPAGIYIAVIGADPALFAGWAIPSATDIAFALGVLALLGTRAPPAVKLLLVTIAIIDDIGAVIIIALFYTAQLDPAALAASALIVGAMATMNLFGERRLWPYLAGFAGLWVAVHESGVHATISGVLAALTVPVRAPAGAASPLERLEHRLNPWVMLGIVPLFGLVSAGVALGAPAALIAPLPLAVMLGLFVGKQAGVGLAFVLAARIRIAALPGDVSPRHLYGGALLTGIGFTMSLFIGALAFPGNAAAVEAAKLGTLAGSLLSALAGYAVLRLARPRPDNALDRAEAERLFAAGGD